MYSELIFVVVAVAGVVTGLMILRALLLKFTTLRHASRSKGRVAMRKRQVRQPMGKAAATAQTSGTLNRQHRPESKKVAKNLAKNIPADNNKRPITIDCVTELIGLNMAHLSVK
jgi:hypothetical protein